MFEFPDNTKFSRGSLDFLAFVKVLLWYKQRSLQASVLTNWPDRTQGCLSETRGYEGPLGKVGSGSAGRTSEARSTKSPGV